MTPLSPESSGATSLLLVGQVAELAEDAPYHYPELGANALANCIRLRSAYTS